MNPGSTAVPEHAARARMLQIFSSQQIAFNNHPYPQARERIARLRALKRQIRRYQDVLAAAMSHDFGFRSPAESKMIDILNSVLDANHAIAHVRRWMKPNRRSTELLFVTNSLQVMYQPKGVVGVIAPWNFPVYLALGPLIAALAAGNRVMIKMSEVVPATRSALARMLGEIFSEDEVAVIGEELDDPGAFAALPFNHIVFTGSPGVGRLVMRAAAENLTPVTLELGGKSPALVTRNYPVADAAKRIVHGKSTNCGQICVSPDYALLPRERVEEFISCVKAGFSGLFGASVSASEDYTCIVNDRHYARIVELLADARAKGATVIPCAEYNAGRDGRKMPLHIVFNCTPDMRIMNEELFGPILPIMPYDTLDEVVERLNSGDRPLALYLFSRDADECRMLLHRTHSGGVTINDWGWHVVNHDAPFGGVGHSGMGTYHGVEGFRELSHAKTVFRRQRFFPVDLFYPPYGNFVQRLSLKLFIGSGDPELTNKQYSSSGG